MSPPETVRETQQPPPRRYVEGRVKLVTRVKSEMPSPPHTPVIRVKSEAPEPLRTTPTRRGTVAPFIRQTPSPRKRDMLTPLRRQSSSAPTTRARAAISGTPSPSKRIRLTSTGPATWPRRSRQPTPGPSRTRPASTPSLAVSGTESWLSRSGPDDPIEVDDSPLSSPTPSNFRETERTRELRTFTPMSNIDAASDRSTSIFRGSSVQAELEDPFLPERQRPIRRREGADEVPRSDRHGPIPVQSGTPQDMRSALGEAETIIRDIRGQGDEESAEAKQLDRQTVVWLYEALMGRPGEDRAGQAKQVTDALADAPDVALIEDLITLFHDAGKKAVMAHVRGYSVDSRARRLPVVVRQAEWYAGWKTYLLHAGEDLKAAMKSGIARRVSEAYEEVMIVDTRSRFEKIQNFLPLVTKEQFRQWRSAVVRRLNEQILVEVFGRT